nr:hypothetical protein [Tanacetum cinerariifolium]
IHCGLLKFKCIYDNTAVVAISYDKVGMSLCLTLLRDNKNIKPHSLLISLHVQSNIVDVSSYDELKDVLSHEKWIMKSMGRKIRA